MVALSAPASDAIAALLSGAAGIVTAAGSVAVTTGEVAAPDGSAATSDDRVLFGGTDGVGVDGFASAVDIDEDCVASA
ncbi:MAG: hypothetical protein WBQ64_20975 [Terriglobales bacterium]